MRSRTISIARVVTAATIEIAMVAAVAILPPILSGSRAEGYTLSLFGVLAALVVPAYLLLPGPYLTDFRSVTVFKFTGLVCIAVVAVYAAFLWLPWRLIRAWHSRAMR